MYNKKCSICGYSFAFEENVVEKNFKVHNIEGAKYYYDLWHFELEKCPKCGYVCRDISKTQNKLIINDPTYLSVPKNSFVQDLKDIRPNKLENYLKASLYYKSIGDDINDALCSLQANDIIYEELVYFKDHFLNTINTVSLLQNQRKYNEFQKFADDLYNYAISVIRNYLKFSPFDFDRTILLAGSLSSGNAVQEIESVNLIKKLRKTKQLAKEQKEAIQFLLEAIEIS